MLIGLGAKSSGESTKALATKVIRQLRIPWLKYHWGKGILITYGQILQKNAASKSLHLTNDEIPCCNAKTVFLNYFG